MWIKPAFGRRQISSTSALLGISVPWFMHLHLHPLPPRHQKRARTQIILKVTSFPSLDLLVAALIADAAKSLKGKVERVGEQITKFFSKLRPELSFSITQDAWNAKLGVNVAANSQEHVGLLIEALNGLEALASEQPEARAVGLIIDEFQRLIEIGGRQAESQIRAAIQRHKHVGYVFAGSKTRMLTDMTMDVTRPFYRLGAIRFIGPVPRTDFEKFLIDKFRGREFNVDDPFATRILEFAEDVPYNVQLLAHTCWDQLRSRSASEKAALTTEVITSADYLMARSESFTNRPNTLPQTTSPHPNFSLAIGRRTIHRLGQGVRTSKRREAGFSARSRTA